MYACVVLGADLLASAREGVAAARVAEMAVTTLGGHHVVESKICALLADLLAELVVIVGRLVVKLVTCQSEPYHKPPDTPCAERFMEAHTLDSEHTYWISQDGAGRYSVGAYRLAGHRIREARDDNHHPPTR